jgi:hypothetical protein
MSEDEKKEMPKKIKIKLIETEEETKETETSLLNMAQIADDAVKNIKKKRKLRL